MSARGFLGGGDLYIARYDSATGQFKPYEGPYECTRFEVKPNVETKESTSKGRDSYGQTIETVTLPKPSDFTVELGEVNREALSLALLGTNIAINQSAGSATNEAVTLVKGAWVTLAHRNVAEAAFAVNVTAGGALLVKDVDYTVNWRLGWIKLLDGSTTPTSTPVQVDYTYNAVTGTKIRGATQTDVRAKFKLDGINFADKLPCIVEVYEGVVAADAAFDFLSDDFATLPLSGRMKTPVGKTEPFVVEMLDSAS